MRRGQIKEEKKVTSIVWQRPAHQHGEGHDEGRRRGGSNGCSAADGSSDHGSLTAGSGSGRLHFQDGKRAASASVRWKVCPQFLCVLTEQKVVWTDGVSLLWSKFMGFSICIRMFKLLFTFPKLGKCRSISVDIYVVCTSCAGLELIQFSFSWHSWDNLTSCVYQLRFIFVILLRYQFPKSFFLGKATELYL